MGLIGDLYPSSLSLLTDLYQLTMAYGYWRSDLGQREAVFHLTFRKNPFGGGFAIAAGLEAVVEFVERFRFEADDLDYLRRQRGNDGQPLFDPAFLDHLADFRITCDIDAVREGTVVFPHAPMVRVRGPLMQAQLLETPLLTLINFPTLVATKAARICMAARGEPVLEFGLRRAQGIDGGVSASRAAYIGGCAGTSNVLAGKLFDIPIKGTHAHSWVMCFDGDHEAFRAWAEAMPNNCVFLVDTYDTLNGVRQAARVGRWLADQGHTMIGIRLDSGDLAYLSIEARRILDEAGLTDAAILASNDLDEHLIASLKEQHATIGVWGVGTKLATAYDEPALGGVYKLSAMRDEAGAWQDRIKLSEQTIKINTPGILQVRRFSEDGLYSADAIYDERHKPADGWTVVDPADMHRRKQLNAPAESTDLLEPVFRAGRRVMDIGTATDARERAKHQLERLHAGIKRFENPHSYPAGLEAGLHARREDLIARAKGESS